MPGIQDIPPELVKYILSYLPEDDELHNTCAAAHFLLQCSTQLIYNSGGSVVLGKRAVNGVRMVGAEERLRFRIKQQLQADNFRCQSLTILNETNSELVQYRALSLLKLARRHTATMTGFHALSCHIPKLQDTLLLFKGLQHLSIQASQDLDLQQFPRLRKLAVQYRPTYHYLRIWNLPNLEYLMIHFDITPFVRLQGVIYTEVDLCSLRGLTSLDLFAGSQSSRVNAIPLTFLHGRSTSLSRVRICGPFEVQDSGELIGVIQSLGPALQVLSLARLRMASHNWDFISLPITAIVNLPHLLALELHDVDPSYLSPLLLPRLQKLVIAHQRHLVLSNSIVNLLQNIGDGLRVLSLAATFNGDGDHQLVPINFVSELLRCVKLERFHLYGRYFFDRRDWRTLCQRVFCDMTSIYICQPHSERLPDEVKGTYMVNFIGEIDTTGLETIADGRSIIRTTELEEWQAVSRNKSSQSAKLDYLRRSLSLADKEGELSIAAGNLPRICRMGQGENHVQKRAQMYSGPKFFTDTAWNDNPKPIELQ